MPNTRNTTCIQLIFQIKGTELTMKNSNQFLAMGISPFLLFSETTTVNLTCCVKLNMVALTGLCNKKEP